MSQITTLILAAGEGKRMKSEKAKVVHQICGKALIEWVYDTAIGAGVDKCVAIVGHKADQVRQYMGDRLEYVLQEQQLGTGHAVQQAHPYYSDGEGIIAVLCGDVPLISSQTIINAIEYLKQENYRAVVISAEVTDPFGYGRIIREEDGSFLKIVEQRDTNDEEKRVREINSGMYIFYAKELAEAVKLLNNHNNQKEYYLTDTMGILRSKGYRAGVYKVSDSDEVLGVNDRIQLKNMSEIIKKRVMESYMLSGVTIEDPGFTHIDAGVRIGADTVIKPGTVIEGKTEIGRNCVIGPNSTIIDSVIGDDCSVVGSAISGSSVESGRRVGPGANMCR